jgi:hypothetical protein
VVSAYGLGCNDLLGIERPNIVDPDAQEEPGDESAIEGASSTGGPIDDASNTADADRTAVDARSEGEAAEVSMDGDALIEAESEAGGPFEAQAQGDGSTDTQDEPDASFDAQDTDALDAGLNDERAEEAIDGDAIDPACVVRPTDASDPNDPNPVVPDGGLTLLAESIAGFSRFRGRCGWNYLYVQPSSGLNTVPMNWDDSYPGWWANHDHYYTWIGALIQHPNGPVSTSADPVEQWSVREWVSNYAGPAVITGLARKDEGTVDAGIGDGVHVLVQLDGANLGEWDIGRDDSVGVTFEFPVTLSQNSHVDFIVEPRGDDWFDSTDIEAAIWK